jgi:hypothetical protein
MDKWSTPELRTAGPATRAEADVRAVLSALQGLSGPAEVEVQPRFAYALREQVEFQAFARG